MQKTIIYVLVVLGWCVVASSASAQRLRISIDGANFRPFPVAAPDTVVIAGGGEARRLARDLTSQIHLDVEILRALELVPPKSYLDASKERLGHPKYRNWANVGASGLIQSGLEVKGDNVKVVFRFFDVVAQREIMTETYTHTVSDMYKACHQFLDDLTEKLTGDKGLFASKLVYVEKTRKGKAVMVSYIDGFAPERITPVDVLSLLPAWSHDGKHILYTSYLKSNPDLYRVTYPGKKLEWLSNKQGVNIGAQVSPDGSRIALTLSIDGNTEIYAMDWNGKNLRRLTDSWGQDVSPTWGPNGKRIAFVSSRSGNPHIYVMNADGSNQKRLTFQGNYNQEPDWSPRPDGQIVFTARDERLKYDIFLVHPDSGEISRLTQDEGNNEGPSFSPDGNQIAFTSTRGGRRSRHIYIMNVDGTNQRRITRGDGADYETPDWGPRL